MLGSARHLGCPAIFRASPGAQHDTCVAAVRRTFVLTREHSSKSGRRGGSILHRLQQQQPQQPQQQQRQQWQQQLLGVMCRGRGVAPGSRTSAALPGGVVTTVARSFRAGEVPSNAGWSRCADYLCRTTSPNLNLVRRLLLIHVYQYRLVQQYKEWSNKVLRSNE